MKNFTFKLIFYLQINVLTFIILKELGDLKKRYIDVVLFVIHNLVHQEINVLNTSVKLYLVFIHFRKEKQRF